MIGLTFIDLTRKRFGHLTAISREKIMKSSRAKTYWICRCDCGNEVRVLMERLQNGVVVDCGKKCIYHVASDMSDLTGKTFGKLTVIKKVDSEKVNHYNKQKWLCKCECGNTIVFNRQGLISGYKKDCGCVKSGKYLEGKRYGKLTIKRVIREKGKDARAECICDCGNITTPLLSRVINNKVHSCGCYRSEKSTELRNKHGMAGTRLHKVWKKMNDRCNNSNNKDYGNYGGRGIGVCAEWSGEHGAENFIKWAYENGYDENAPHGKCTIDRIDVNGNYEPSNCRWVDMKMQSYNRRNTTKIMIDGREMSIKEISEKYDIPVKTIRSRIDVGILEEKRLLYKGDLRSLK